MSALADDAQSMPDVQHLPARADEPASTQGMPDLRQLHQQEHIAAMTSWLRARGVVIEDAASAERAWHAERKKMNKLALRQRENSMPAPLLRLITTGAGLSKESRAANDLFRFAQFALPKGTHANERRAESAHAARRTARRRRGDGAQKAVCLWTTSE